MGKKFWLWSTACRKQVLVFWKWLALRTVRPTGKEALTSTVHADSNYPVRGRQAILSTVRKKAVQQVFLFFCFFSLIYVQHQLHPTALFVCTTMRIIYIVLCIAAKRRYHNTFQDIHKQRDYSIFFCACFTIFLQKYPPAMKSCCFCKHQAMSWNGFHTLGHCTQTWKHTSGDLHSKIIMETWTYRNGESTTKITQWPTLIF